MLFKKSKLLIIHIWLLLTFISSSLSAQLYFDAYYTADGLPSSIVYNTFQDKYGFLWVSTEEGIARFDGYDFNTYFDDFTNSVALKGATEFFEDSKGQLWAVNADGHLNKYNRIKNVFEGIPMPLEGGWIVQSTHDILEDDLGNLWISGYGGLQYYDVSKDTVIVYPCEKIRAPKSWPHKEKVRLGKMHFDGQNIWLGTRKFGLVKFELATKTYTFFRFDPRFKNNLLGDWIPDLIPISKDTLIIADHNHGIVYWNCKTETMEDTINFSASSPDVKSQSILDIFIDINQQLWIGTEKHGLLQVDLKSNKIVATFQADEQQSYSILSNKVSHINQDKNGVFWLGTSTLQQASHLLYKHQELRYSSIDANSLRDNRIFNLAAAPDGMLLASTFEGLSVYDPELSEFDNSIDFKHSLKNSFGALGAKDGSYWIGTDKALYQLDSKKRNILKTYDSDVLLDTIGNQVRKICRLMEASNSTIWAIDHWGRLRFIEPKNKNIKNIYELAQDPETGRFISLKCMLDDPQYHRIIVGSNMGLFTVDYETKKSERIQLGYQGQDLSKEEVSYFFRGKDDKIWLLINGKPYYMDPATFELSLMQIKKEDNVGSFKWLVEQPRGTYWLSSYKGILKFNPASSQSSTYFSANVAGDSFESPSPVAELNGKIYFSGFEGITMIDPAAIVDDNRDVKVKFSALTINQKEYESDVPVNAISRLDLPYFNNDIDLKLSTFDFVLQDNIEYAYRLKPRDEVWNVKGNDNHFQFHNLPPGNYSLELKAANSTGVWSDQITNLDIEIKPPWWRSLWFQGLLLIAIIGMILLWQQNRFKQLFQRKADIQLLRNKISSDLHDDVGTMMAGIAMQSELLGNFIEDEKGKKLANQIADKSRIAMDTMRDTVWAIDGRKDKIGDLISRMLDFVADTLEARDISCKLSSNIADKEQYILPTIRQAVYLVFKESIINIIKHSDSKRVDIKLSYTSSSIVLIIKDFGTTQDVKTSGQGMLNMKRRAEKLNGTFSFEYDNGFTTILKIPITKRDNPF